MRFDAEAYEKVFPRKTPEAKTSEVIKPGNVLEEADKVITPEPETPEPKTDPEPVTGDPGGGVENGD